MKTIVVFNQKGGVGKTSTVINMMSELSLRHKKVLAIDLDAQCNLTSFCGFKYSKYSVVDWLLSDKLKLDFVVCNTKDIYIFFFYIFIKITQYIIFLDYIIMQFQLRILFLKIIFDSCKFNFVPSIIFCA